MLIFILAYAFCTSLNARIIIVDNNVPSAGDYSTLQKAHDAAEAGDIIYVVPSFTPYNAITVTKSLTFYGVGFEITKNIGEPFTKVAKISGLMTFNSGSERSWLEGFDGNFKIVLNTKNITIKKNNLNYVNVYSSNCTIIENKIIGNAPEYHLFSQYTIYIADSSILIANNVIINPNNNSHEHAIGGGKNLTIYNNVIKANNGNTLDNVRGSEIVNNILVYGGLQGCTYSNFRNNMYWATSTYFNNGYGNIQNVDMKTVFVDPDNYDFHLLPNSPARGAGENGTDMGIYGGDAPFVDGGFPELPVILQLVVPTIGSKKGGLEIKFKAKSNN